MASEIQQTSTAIDEMRSKFKQSIIQIYLYWAELNYLSLFILDISCKLFFLEVQWGSSLIDPVLLQEET